MTSIWKQSDDDKKWHLLSAMGFAEETELHKLVAKSPEILPLAGQPRSSRPAAW
jgi:hypothetical protein